MTTADHQPLDVFFDRQYKKLWKRIRQAAFDDSDEALAELLSRGGILNVQSLMWDQFNSPRYENMIRYAWHKTDIFFDHGELAGEYIEIVQDIQFAFDESDRCEAYNCTRYAFIKCSHCKKRLCIHHFLARQCFHWDEEEDDDIIEPFCRPFVERGESTTARPREQGSSTANRPSSSTTRTTGSSSSTTGAVVGSVGTGAALGLASGLASEAYVSSASAIAASSTSIEMASALVSAVHETASVHDIELTAGDIVAFEAIGTDEELTHLLGRADMKLAKFEKLRKRARESGRFEKLFANKIL